jgi:hypothetical protein
MMNSYWKTVDVIEDDPYVRMCEDADYVMLTSAAPDVIHTVQKLPPTKGCVMRARILTVSLVTAAGLLLPASSALAVAPTNASCIGQFFSSHAGLAAAHTEPRNVGEFTSAAARELGREFGATISSARDLPREDCGL